METLLLNAKNKGATDAAAGILKKGGLVAIPTETVYGLAANAFDENACSNIFKAKGRPGDNPLIVHICNMDMLGEVVEEIPEGAKKLAEKFWPGPLTIIMKKSEKVPAVTSANLPTVAVRFPAHPVAREIIEKSGLPLAAPSANLSGSPSPTTFEHCVHDLMGRVEGIIDGGACESVSNPPSFPLREKPRCFSVQDMSPLSSSKKPSAKWKYPMRCSKNLKKAKKSFLPA